MRLFEGLDARWWVAGGWAIDLWLGRKTREHVDLDIAILRSEQRAFWELLDGWDLHLGTAPNDVEPWNERDVIRPPLHAIWCRPTPESDWAFELLLNDSEDGDWLFRRDHSVRMPLTELGGQQGGLPFLKPEVVLLFKAKNVRAHDQLDFEQARERLSVGARRWLRLALQRVHPDHEWLAGLAR